MIVQFPRKERVEADLPNPDGRAADLHAMDVMLSYLESEASRHGLSRLAELLGVAVAELRRS